jgi:hypothetical protein
MEVGRQFLARRERGAMHEKIQSAKVAIDRGKHLGNLPVVGHIAGKKQRVCQLCGELSHVFFEPLTLIGDGKARARGRCRLCNGPRDRSFVGDADDEPCLVGEIGHGVAALLLNVEAAGSGCGNRVCDGCA